MIVLLSYALQALIIEIWIICALLCWKYDLWAPELPKPDKDGFIPLNRRVVDMARQQL